MNQLYKLENRTIGKQYKEIKTNKTKKIEIS